MDNQMKDPYIMPGTNGVLKNKFGIVNEDFLKEIETAYVTHRLEELKTKPIEGNFDFYHLKEIHKHLYQDVYDWAGQPRTTELKNSCLPEHIEDKQKNNFQLLQNENCFKGMNSQEFAVKTAQFASELNAVQPFRNGNDLVHKEFMREFAEKAGYELDLSKVPPKHMEVVMTKSFQGDAAMLKDVIENNLKPLENKHNMNKEMSMVM